MPDVTKDMLIRLLGDNSSFEKAFKDSQNIVTGFKREATSALRGVTLASGTAAAALGTLAAITKKAADAAGEGQKFIELEKSFENLQTRAGLLADDSLAKLRTATQGMVSDMRLMEQANKAVQLGLDPSTLDVMAEAATKLGASVGRDATAAFEDLVTGVGRASPLILDNLGITIKANEAYDRYAASLKKATKDLTENEKAEAFRAVALEKIREKAEQLDKVTINAGLAAKQFDASWDNAVKQITKGIAESDSLADAINGINAAMQKIDWEAIGADIAEFAANVARAVGWIVDFVDKVENLVAADRHWRREIVATNRAQIDQAKTTQDLFAVLAKFNLEAQKARHRQEEVAEAQRKARIPSLSLGIEYDSLTGVIGGYNDLMLEVIKKMEGFSNEATKPGGTIDSVIKIAAAFEGVNEGFFEFVGPFASNNLLSDLNKEIEALIKESNELLRDQWQESADFFSDALYNAMTGAAFDAKDMMLRILAGVAGGFGAQVAQAIGLNIGQFTSLQGAGQAAGSSIFSGIFGSGASALGISGLGSAFGAGAAGELLPGAAGAAGGGAYGAASFGASLGPALPYVGAAALIAAGGYFGLDALGVFDGGKDPDQRRRDSIRDRLRGTGLGDDLILRGIRGNIDIGRSDFNLGGGLAGESVGLVSGLGSLFGGDETGRNQLTAMFANAVSDAENFNEALIQTQSLMQQLGVNAEQAKNELSQLFLDGEIGLEEYQRGMESLNLAAQDNLVGTGSVRDALNVVADATSTNRARLQGLRLTFVELAEIGVDSVAEIRDYFTERFGPDVGDVFAMLAEAGIDFANITSDQVGLIFNALQPILNVLETELPNAYKRAEKSAENFAKSAVSSANSAADALGRIGQLGGGGLITDVATINNLIRTGQSRTGSNKSVGING